MSEHISISVIVPVYNANSFLDNCINSLLNQNFDKNYEIIMVDDASSDDSRNIIEKVKSPLIKLISLNSNCGPANARNEGLKIAKGEYIYFLDVDDSLDENTFKELYYEAKKNNLDLVISDKKLIINSINFRKNIYIFDDNKSFNKNEITNQIKERLHNPSYHQGLIGVTGRLMKHSIIRENNLLFQKDFRYLEDEVFSWDFISFCKKIKYIRKQLYNFYVYPNTKTGISEGLSRGYSIKNFKIAKERVLKCFQYRELPLKECKSLADQAIIFFIISALVSFSRSIILGKVNLHEGKIKKKEMITSILKDNDIIKAAKNYKCSKNENEWIPRSIRWRSKFLLGLFCHIRAKKILKIRLNSYKK